MDRAIAIVIALFLFGVVAAPCAADDTDPGGTVLRAYVENYLENALPSDALAQKIKAAGGVNAVGANEWLCSLEINNTYSTGYRIWAARLKADTAYAELNTKSQYIPLNLINYCISCSNKCGHWRWNGNCFKP